MDEDEDEGEGSRELPIARLIRPAPSDAVLAIVMMIRFSATHPHKKSCKAPKHGLELGSDDTLPLSIPMYRTRVSSTLGTITAQTSSEDAKIRSENWDV